MVFGHGSERRKPGWVCLFDLAVFHQQLAGAADPNEPRNACFSSIFDQGSHIRCVAHFFELECVAIVTSHPFRCAGTRLEKSPCTKWRWGFSMSSSFVGVRTNATISTPPRSRRPRKTCRPSPPVAPMMKTFFIEESPDYTLNRKCITSPS